MVISRRRYYKTEPSREMEPLFRPLQPRKDSSFHTKDKRDYSDLLGSMKGNKRKK